MFGVSSSQIVVRGGQAVVKIIGKSLLSFAL